MTTFVGATATYVKECRDGDNTMRYRKEIQKRNRLRYSKEIQRGNRVRYSKEIRRGNRVRYREEIKQDTPPSSPSPSPCRQDASDNEGGM